MRFVVEGLPGPLHLRFHPGADGRLRVRELYLVSDEEPIEARHVRPLRLHQFEATANSRLLRRALDDELDEQVPQLAQMLAEQCDWDEVPEVGGAALKLPPLQQPEGNKYDDEFYERVANHFVVRLEAGKAPARDIAQALGVPVTTVHRWVREARRRGYLAPTRRGRPG